jgi:hypothetical protein
LCVLFAWHLLVSACCVQLAYCELQHCFCAIAGECLVKSLPLLFLSPVCCRGFLFSCRFVTRSLLEEVDGCEDGRPLQEV